MEEWKDVTGWEGKYMVSDQGRVLSLRGDWTMLKPVMRAGYPSVTFSGRGRLQHYTIHRLVMDIFSPDNPNNLREVDHKYGDKYDARLSSLERVSSSENKKRAYKLGLADKKGENHPRCKMTNEIVLDIFNSNTGSALIAAKYNISQNTVNDIRRGYRWGHLTGKSRAEG